MRQNFARPSGIWPHHRLTLRGTFPYGPRAMSGRQRAKTVVWLEERRESTQSKARPAPGVEPDPLYGVVLLKTAMELKRRQDVASKEAEAMAHGYREMVNRVVRETKLAYFDLALVLESIRLTEKNKGILEQFLKIAEGRYSVGQATQADVLKAQTQLSKMVEELLRMGRERPMFEAELLRALGAEIGARFLDTCERDLQIQVVRQRALDEGVEHRILELLPPRGFERLLGHAGALRFDERRRRGIGRHVVRSDGAGGEQRRDTGQQGVSHGSLPTESTQRRRRSCR